MGYFNGSISSKFADIYRTDLQVSRQIQIESTTDEMKVMNMFHFAHPLMAHIVCKLPCVGLTIQTPVPLSKMCFPWYKNFWGLAVKVKAFLVNGDVLGS